MNRGLPPLRYNISDWHQLPGCKSNNSRELKLVVTDLIKNSVLEGVVIKVMHETFGVLFACTVGGSGNLLTTAKGLAGGLPIGVCIVAAVLSAKHRAKLLQKGSIIHREKGFWKWQRNI